MPSVGSAIKQHNSKLLNPTNTDTLPCNCQDKTKCPVPDACRTKTVVYTAVVTAEDTERVYHGSTEGEVKARISGHETSFRHRQYEHETSLSQYIWQLKDRDLDYTRSCGALNSRLTPIPAVQGGVTFASLRKW